MNESQKHPKLVGSFIRQRREALGLSQRALGLLFNPAVTTQFISNVERGVTPLPPAHVPTLVKALMVTEQELMALLEQEYTAKLSGRLGHASAGGDGQAMVISNPDYDFMKSLYEAYREADPNTRQAFVASVANLLNLPKRAPN